jgi:hypothetical protein
MQSRCASVKWRQIYVLCQKRNETLAGTFTFVQAREMLVWDSLPDTLVASFNGSLSQSLQVKTLKRTRVPYALISPYHFISHLDY